MNVKLEWSTPNVDNTIARIARVSNPAMQDKPIGSILQYMMREGHTSPFGQANVCLEITATRDISRQIMRHWSMEMHELEVQEFSQRYANVDALPDAPLRECRLQDIANRQNSLKNDDAGVAFAWKTGQESSINLTHQIYKAAIESGIAKEVARAVLPEGLTMSRFYLNGTMRSWIFFLKSRLHATAQKEVREIGAQILAILRDVAPEIIGTFFDSDGQFIDLQQRRIEELERELRLILDAVDGEGEGWPSLCTTFSKAQSLLESAK